MRILVAPEESAVPVRGREAVRPARRSGPHDGGRCQPAADSAAGRISGAMSASWADLSESAAASRWRSLPALGGKIAEHPIVGSGFGSTVTYRSQDLRVVAATGGTYTISAFESGLSGLWVKSGILGVVAMGWIPLLGRRVRRGDGRSCAPGRGAWWSWRRRDDAFTPPSTIRSGFAALYLLEGWVAIAKRPTEA